MSFFETIGLTPDMDSAISALREDPREVSTSFGDLTIDDGRLVSTLSPDFQNLLNQFLGEIGTTTQEGVLSQLREQAAPFEEQQALNLENRLFSQGIMGHSAVDRPGGARRSLFDAQANADLMRQIQSIGLADQRRSNLLRDILGIQSLEGGLFSASFGAPDNSGAVSNLMATSQMANANAMQNLLLGGLIGFS